MLSSPAVEYSIRQGCSNSPFLVNFVMDQIMLDVPGGLQDVGVEVGNREKL